MNLQEIEHLIIRYEQGETTLEEEERLRKFFAGKNIPAHLADYKILFDFYETAAEEELPDTDFDRKLLDKIGVSKPHGIRRMYAYIGAAASIAILAALFFILQYQKPDLGTYDDPQVAYAETRKILLEVSGNLNTGMKELSNVKSLNTGMRELHNIQSFNDGMQSLEKISILDKSKQIVTQ